MEKHLYLSLSPESLIASMLPPEEFGHYYATGTKAHSSGLALFFKLKPDFRSDSFPMGEVETRCVPHKDGSARKSIYLGIYRVLEHVPLEALGKLYLVTEHGKVLGLEPQTYQPYGDAETPSVYMYQEFCPVIPRVVSTLDPKAFCRRITDPEEPVSVDKIVFCDMILNELAEDPMSGKTDDLPYRQINHLRSCIHSIKNDQKKNVKTLQRGMERFTYRTVKGGFYVGDANGMLYYPMPSRKDLEGKFYSWWRFA